MLDYQAFLTTICSVDNGASASPPSPTGIALSCDFPGTSGAYLTDGGSSFELGSGDYTITLFFRPTFIDNVGELRDIFTKGSFDTGNESGCVLRISATSVFDRVEVDVSDGTTIKSVISANSSITNNAWHFVTIQYDSGAKSLSLSINRGTAATTSSVESLNVSSGAEIRVGGTATTGFSDYQGQMSSFGIWTRVLTGTELDEIYNSGSGKLYSDISAGTKANVLAYWQLDEMSDGSTEVDRLASAGGVDLIDSVMLSSSVEVPS